MISFIELLATNLLQRIIHSLGQSIMTLNRKSKQDYLALYPHWARLIQGGWCTTILFVIFIRFSVCSVRGVHPRVLSLIFLCTLCRSAVEIEINGWRRHWLLWALQYSGLTFSYTNGEDRMDYVFWSLFMLEQV